MAENSKIEWTDHTFNLGWGCVEKSEGCRECYAKKQALRYGFDVWGKKKPPRILSPKYYEKPHKWDGEARAEGKRKRVFCGSMMDWTDDIWFIMRPYLWQLWRDTPWLG
jgi:protein gp37